MTNKLAVICITIMYIAGIIILGITSSNVGKAECKQEYIRGYIQGALDIKNGEKDALEKMIQLLLEEKKWVMKTMITVMTSGDNCGTSHMIAIATTMNLKVFVKEI